MATRKSLSTSLKQRMAEYDEFDDEVEVAPKRPKKRKGSLAVVLNVVLLLAVIGLGYLYFTSAKAATPIQQNAEAQAEAAKDELRDYEDAIRKLAIVPEDGEAPQLLYVQDAELAVKEQPVLNGVVAGDVIIVYVNNKKAYVYSPSRNRIINILPLASQVQATAPATTTNSRAN